MHLASFLYIIYEKMRVYINWRWNDTKCKLVGKLRYVDVMCGVEKRGPPEQ